MGFDTDLQSLGPDIVYESGITSGIYGGAVDEANGFGYFISTSTPTYVCLMSLALMMRIKGSRIVLFTSPFYLEPHPAFLVTWVWRTDRTITPLHRCTRQVLSASEQDLWELCTSSDGQPIFIFLHPSTYRLNSIDAGEPEHIHGCGHPHTQPQPRGGCSHLRRHPLRGLRCLRSHG